MIPLEKKTGVRPIGVGEVLRRIIGKTTSAMFKEDIKETAGPLQVCAGHSAGSEAAIHSMNKVFNEEGAEFRDSLYLISLVTVPVEKCLLSTTCCHVRREVL